MNLPLGAARYVRLKHFGTGHSSASCRLHWPVFRPVTGQRQLSLGANGDSRNKAVMDHAKLTGL